MASTLVLFVCAVFAGFSGSAAQSTYNPDSQNVYHLFTKQNPTTSQPMILGFPTLIGSNFDTSRRTVLLIHGYGTGPTSDFNLALVPTIIAVSDVNLIVVDWSAGAIESDYNVLISRNIPLCAESIARFIVWLNQQTGYIIEGYGIIGFEVGSHLGGIVGKNLNGEIPFITGLNPPSHGFNFTNMLFPTDGIYTEAIHTDIFGTGMLEGVAMADFYPAGGLTQPGCDPLNWECSRDRSFIYLAESLVTGGFTGVRCYSEEDAMTGQDCDESETLPMGGLTDKTGRIGYFHLNVNAQSPFSQG